MVIGSQKKKLPKLEEQLQEFTFTIKLKVSGEVLQEHDVRSILRILGKAELFRQHDWLPNCKGTKAKKKYLCSICHENVKKNQICFQTSCNHVFHKKCVQMWFQTQSQTSFELTCPMCRKEQQVDFCNDNVYHVNTKYEVVDGLCELERTIRRNGSNYVRYHNMT